LVGFGGLVTPGRNRDPWDLVPNLLRLYPRRRTVVAVRNRRGVRDWRRHLRSAHLGRRVVAVTDPDIWRGRSTVMVLSLEMLGHCQPGEFGLLIVTDVGPLRSCPLVKVKRSKFSADRFDRLLAYPVLRHPIAPRDVPFFTDRRVPAFGFVPQGFGPSDAEMLTLMSFFGPVLEPQLDVRVTVEVAEVPPTANVPDEILAAKRVVWTDAGRNGAIARLATDASATRSNGRVVVLVAGAVHAAAVEPLLGGWTVVGDDAGAPVPDRGIVSEARLVRDRRLIADVVIDARGWGPLSPDNFDRGAEVTVVDVPVRGHPEFERRAEDRHAKYADFGWSVAPVEAEPSE
jgi:hypothetical protein